MYAPEIEAPMDLLPGVAPEIVQNVRRLAHALPQTVTEAAIALDLFEQAWVQRDATMPPGWFDEEPNRAAQAARVVLTEDRPRSYFSVAPHLHARTFVFSLRMIGVLLETIAEDAESVRPDFKRISEDYNASFPRLRELRNSIAHMEDRLRGLHGVKNKKPIVLQAVPELAPQGGALFNDFLHGRSLTWTVADGSAASCEVSERSLRVAVGHVEELIRTLV